ncbi:hypothetical protein [Maledivibacter halophilus]|uniref:Uncharacterized protein n=1 Tax=Maledivibacter halophilus TaxID=36842 RepID=A0A1T5M6A8_9FIRM|nr:hypothetical protein [Maledivibacter halophilus]SKC83761.1 hypothetical protein SAMN02194393_03989 [Maledivibacter halophilus]
MKGYTPITTLKDFVYTYSSHKSDTEIAYLLNITISDIKAVRKDFVKKSKSEELKVL